MKMVLNREEAAQRAEKTTRNKVGMCQQVTRGYYFADSAGDVDHDGDSDARDGWLKENPHGRHTDRHPPRGVPVTFSNNSHWHRAESLGDGLIRSTDFSTSTKRYKEGVVGTGTIAQVEAAMGVTYVGWSETIDGEQIPMPPPPAPTRLSKFHAGAPRYDLRLIDHAVANGRGELKPVLRKIAVLVAELPDDEGPSRVKSFKRAYKSDHVLRMGLLSEAVKEGRTGEVKKVRDALKAEIKKIPKR